MFGNKQKNQVIEKITPLIEKVADARVEKVMDIVSKKQIAAYEDFFKKQGDRFDDILHAEMGRGRTKDLIVGIIDERLDKLGLLK